MRQSQHFGITLKEAPREAQTTGPALLQRAGFLRSAAAGIPVVMPGLLRVLNRLAGILRTELDARGFVELALPLLQPAALWEGPAPEPGIFAFKDRRGAVLGIPVWRTTKTLLFQADDRLAAVMVRGDCEVNEDKVRRRLHCRDLSLASAQAIRELTGAEVGYAGGVGLPPGVVVLADHFTRGRVNFECGANRTDHHLINVNWGRDLPLPVFGDFKLAREGDRCLQCDRGRIREIRGIGLGRLLRPDAAAGAGLRPSFQARGGKPQPAHMGSGRLNLNRLVAALVEQHHDGAGLRWPPRVAPFDVHLVGLNLEDEGLRSEAESIYRRLRAEKFEVLFDDRDARAGEKFSDSDLIGVPVRLTISRRTFAEGRLEFKRRGDAQSRMVTFDEARTALADGDGASGDCR